MGNNDIIPLINDGKKVEQRFTENEATRMKAPHSPDCFLVCCIDSRFQPAKALQYGPNIALEYRPIACVVPPASEADLGLQSRMAFRRLKKVSNIVLVCHSDCGGAQAALQVLQPDLTKQDDLHTVAGFVHSSGLDIPFIGQQLLQRLEGNIREAGDHLAKAVGIKSLQNLMGYKGQEGYATIGDEISAGVLDVKLFYFDMEQRRLELYNRSVGKWEHTRECEDFSLEGNNASATRKAYAEA